MTAAIGPAPDLATEIFAGRRERFLSLLGGDVAVVPAAPELIRSRDTEVPYRQASDLYYLTGFREPESVAVFTPHDPEHRFTLFVRPRDPEREAWVGPRVGVEGARERFGADAVYPIAELASRLPGLLRAADLIRYPFGASDTLDNLVQSAITRGRRGRQRSGVGPIGLLDLEVSTGEMRLVKDAAEIDRLRTSAKIAAAGHLEAMGRARPGAGEWEIQATFEAAIRSRGAADPAFLTIVGAGANATVLHYVENGARIEQDQLVLIDAGAEWGMYCSDISRTFPVSGRFLPHQRDLYEIVLAAEEAAIRRAAPAATLPEIHEAALRVLAAGMIDLGILRDTTVDEAIETGAYRRFYPHQTSHWLGLDVHDAGPYARSSEPVHLSPGMIFTVEPGIYVPADALDVPEHFRGTGIRIEDDVLIHDDGSEVITRDVPVDLIAIEELVGQYS